MKQETRDGEAGVFPWDDSDAGQAPGAVKRPWPKPTVSLMHRIVRVHTGMHTNLAGASELPIYTAMS